MKKFNFYAAAVASSWLLVLLIIAAELYGPFKILLKTFFMHHWIGKAVIITAAFVVAGYFYKKELSEKTTWFSVLASLAAIFLFFIIEFFI